MSESLGIRRIGGKKYNLIKSLHARSGNSVYIASQIKPHNHADKQDVGERVILKEMFDNTEINKRALEIRRAFNDILDASCFPVVLDYEVRYDRLRAVFSFVEGTNLVNIGSRNWEKLKQGALLDAEDAYQVYSIVLAIIKRINDLMAEGLVHTDIKPANLIMQGDDTREVSVIDFDGFTFSGLKIHCPVGTHGFNAPEVRQYGVIQTVNFSVDVYSAGMTTLDLCGLYADYYPKAKLGTTVTGFIPATNDTLASMQSMQSMLNTFLDQHCTEWAAFWLTPVCEYVVRALHPDPEARPYGEEALQILGSQ